MTSDLTHSQDQLAQFFIVVKIVRKMRRFANIMCNSVVDDGRNVNQDLMLRMSLVWAKRWVMIQSDEGTAETFS